MLSTSSKESSHAHRGGSLRRAGRRGLTRRRRGCSQYPRCADHPKVACRKDWATAGKERPRLAAHAASERGAPPTSATNPASASVPSELNSPRRLAQSRNWARIRPCGSPAIASSTSPLNVGAGELTKAATEADPGLVRGVEDVAAALLLVAHRLTGQGPAASISPFEAPSMQPSQSRTRPCRGWPFRSTPTRDHDVAAAESASAASLPFNTPPATSCAPA